MVIEEKVKKRVIPVYYLPVNILKQKQLNQYALNLVEGWGMGQRRTHSILEQIWIIYSEFEFFSLVFGLFCFTMALAEVYTLLSTFSIFFFMQFSYLHSDS